ncbi:MAG: DsbA family protein [Cellvibrionaceae bacterium]
MSNVLYYIHDPMCSWCWGFRPVWHAIKNSLPNNITVKYVLGGLAPDSDELMPEDVKHYVQANWRRIEQTIPGTQFNDEFWRQCKPRRSTYPSCRAVLAAKKQGVEFEEAMIEAIQHAYYLNAQNPSDNAVLIQLAGNINLKVADFEKQLNSTEIQTQLMQNLELYGQLSHASGASGFPSLVLKLQEKYKAIPRDYTNPETTLFYIQQQMEISK